jgi:hypothetical protein
MLRDFFAFLRAFWDEWKVLLTGGTIIAALALWTFGTGKAIPRAIDWLILGLTLMLAAFFSWRKQWVAGKRGFIDISPAELAKLCRDRTTFQAAAVIEPYIGKSIRVRLFFNDAATLFPFCVYAHLSDSETFYGVWTTFWVPLSKRKVFMALQKGMLLTIAGRISSVEAYTVRLRSVLLLKIEEPSKPSSGSKALPTPPAAIGP